MLFEGSILGGAIVLDSPADLPDGTRVRVEPVAAPGRQPIASLQAVKEKLERENPPPAGPTISESMAPFIGCLDGLPPDAATNHDYYIRHGLLTRPGVGT